MFLIAYHQPRSFVPGVLSHQLIALGNGPLLRSETAIQIGNSLYWEM